MRLSTVFVGAGYYRALECVVYATENCYRLLESNTTLAAPTLESAQCSRVLADYSAREIRHQRRVQPREFLGRQRCCLLYADVRTFVAQIALAQYGHGWHTLTGLA